jgi:uncharacterized protein (DUF1501 family)
MNMTRRKFMQGCCAGIAAMQGTRLGGFAWGDTGNLDAGHPILVHVFLRGGMDSMTFLPPYADAQYHAERKVLGLKDTQVIDVDGYFGFHPTAAPLHELFTANHLAVINACGMPEVNRSHFKAQEIIELAGKIPGERHTGWLTRYLESTPGSPVFKGVSIGSALAESMHGSNEVVSMGTDVKFALPGDWHQLSGTRRALRKMWRNDGDYGDVALQTLDTFDFFAANKVEDYVPTEGTEYQNNGFGLMAATVDLGGWDTHENQSWGGIEGPFNNLVGELSGNLHAFWNDLHQYHGRLTVVVMSEFGRRLRENANRGTDHGHAGLLMALGSGVAEQKIYGAWPGLKNDQLTERADLRVTTDYRVALAEILRHRTAVRDTASIFPDLNTTAPKLGLYA